MMNRSIACVIWMLAAGLVVANDSYGQTPRLWRNGIQTAPVQRAAADWASRPVVAQAEQSVPMKPVANRPSPRWSGGEPGPLQNRVQTVSGNLPVFQDEQALEDPFIGVDPGPEREEVIGATPWFQDSAASMNVGGLDGNPNCRNRVRGSVAFDSCLSRELLDFQNRQTDKTLMLLGHQPVEGYPELILGGQMRASFLAAGTNRTNKFSYLGRFPPDFVGNSATDARLLHGNLSATGHFSRLAHGQVELLFSDVFSFPTFKQGSFQVRQAYIAVGDLEASPFYAFLGKQNVSFGDMRTLSPFSQSVVWHYFGALAEGVGGGINGGNWNLSATALNGGRGIRVADSSAIGQLNNFAVNGLWQMPLGYGDCLQLGAGYLHGTIYDAGTAEHTNPGLFGERNPAWDVNGNLSLGLWQFSAEFVTTVDPWPVTGHAVTAWRSELARDVSMLGLPARLSGSFSEGIQGDRGSEFEFNKQLVIGLGVYPTVNTQITFEYVRSSGFAPLLDITTVSDREVQQDSFVLGLVFVL
jgi:hypothetical protein